MSSMDNLARIGLKTCNTCGHAHESIPEGGKPHRTGYYFQCAGGCNSTLLVPPFDKPHLCERCGYDEAETDATVPDMFQDRYQDLCSHCSKELYRTEARLDPN